MATFQSSTANYQTLSLELWSTDVVDASTTSVTLLWNARLNRGVNIVDTSNQLDWSGKVSGSLSNLNLSGSGMLDLGTQIDGRGINRGTSIPLTYQPQTVTLTVALRGVDYAGQDLVASGSITIPARVAAPPTALMVTRQSDAQHALAWTAGQGATQTLIERSTNGASFVQVAQLAGAPASWVDTSTLADSSYVWRVRSVNGSGSSSWATSSTIYTTPATPTAVTASKSASGISVSFTSSARWAASFEAQDTPGGGSWSTVASGASSPLLHANPSTAATHAYQVRAVAPGGLASAWSASSQTVALLAAPNPPSNLTSGVVDPTEAVTVTWQHNPVDTTRQTQYRIRWGRASDPVTAWTVDTVTSATSARTFAANALTALGAVGWQVQTRGDHADFSGWSPVATLTLSRRPVMGMQGGPQKSGTVSASWSYFDPEGTVQAAWRVRLLVDGKLVETLAGTGQATSVTFAAHVADGASVVRSGEVQDSSGQWSLTSTTDAVTVAYELPAPPVLTISFDVETGMATLQVTNPRGGLSLDVDGVPTLDAAGSYGIARDTDGVPYVTAGVGAPTVALDTDGVPYLTAATGSGVPAVVSNRILAEDGSGGWRVLGTVGPQGSLTDRTPILGIDTIYRVEATSALPSTATADQVVRFNPADRIWLTSGDATVSGRYGKGNPAEDVTSSRRREHVELEGREWPLAQNVGRMRSQAIGFSASVLLDCGSTIAEFEALAFGDAPVCYRNPDGRRAWCTLDSVKASQRRTQQGEVSLALTRTGSLDERA